MRILEIRKGSTEEAELLEAAAAAHGGWVYAAARLMDRLLLMRSAWAPGLRYVGGIARSGSDGAGLALSVGGTGLRLEDALASCLGEAVERLAQIERAGDVVLTAPIDEVDVPDQIGELIDLIHSRDPATPRTPIDWVRARSCTTGDETLVPADWCLRRANPLALAVPGSTLSTGCAAAAALEDAVARGLLELIERDAASLWWHGGRSPTQLRRDSPEAAGAARITGELRQTDESGRRTRVVDITSDLAVPVMAALSHREDGTGLAIGLAARLSPARAVGSALLELTQMELGLQLASSKREQIGEAALTAEDRRHLARAAASVADLAPLAVHDMPRRHTALPVGSGLLQTIVGPMMQGGLDVWYVDVTRSDYGLVVAKVIAPRLQPMPGDIETARLAAVRGRQSPPSVTIM